MVLSLDLRERIAHRFQEILVRSEDASVEVEFDHRLRTHDCRNAAGVLQAAGFLRGDVVGKLHDPCDFAGPVEDRGVARLKPDPARTFRQALELAGAVLAAPQFVPERAVGFAVSLVLFDEHAVVVAHDFGQGIAHRVQECLVGVLDLAAGIELHDGLGPVEGLEQGVGVA